MPRRIEVELTSSREDGTWTWRAAGAKQPKGELDGSLLFPGAKVGDVVKADAEFFVDGITVTAVQAPKERSRKEPERIELLGPPQRDDQLVTTSLVGKSGRRDRGPRRDRDRDGRHRRDGDRNDRDRNDRRPRGEGSRRDRGPRPERKPVETKPKAPRLRPGRTHRKAALDGLPPERRPIAEQVLRGGIPAVRQAIDKQNEANAAAGKPPINAAPLLGIAEQLVPQMRAAEWRDKAEAAMGSVAEVDLRDLRSVVVAADQGARDDESRQLAEQLKTALGERVEHEQRAWLAEIAQTLEDGRVVRALRLSSRPPKAGEPLPADLAARLSEATAAGLTAETSSERYATVIDALSFAPVRTQVTPQGVPAKPSDELLKAVRKQAKRLPKVAEAFGVAAPAAPAKGRAARGGRPVPPPPAKPAPPATPPAVEPGPKPAASLDEGAAPAGTLPPGDEPAAAIEPAPEPAAALDAGTAPAAAIEAPPEPQPAVEPEPEAAVEPEAAPPVEAETEPAPAPAAESSDGEQVQDVEGSSQDDVAGGGDRPGVPPGQAEGHTEA